MSNEGLIGVGAEFLAAVRALGHADRLFTQAVADRLSLNLVDLLCLDLLDRQGELTAGMVAERTGLTTGAITGLADRLERAGLVVRARAPEDRRQVRLRLSDEAKRKLEALRAPAYAAVLGALPERSSVGLRDSADLLRVSAAALDAQTEALRARDAAPSAKDAGPLSAPVGRLTRASLQFGAGAANLHVVAEKKLDELFRLSFEGKPPRVRFDGDDGTVRVDYARFAPFDWRKAEASVRLNAKVAWSLEVKGGASAVHADLRALGSLTSVDVKGGASEFGLELPPPKGRVPIRLAGGGSKVALQRARGVALELEVRGGVSKLVFDGQKLGSLGGLVRLHSSGYSPEKDAYLVQIAGGASDLSIIER